MQRVVKSGTDLRTEIQRTIVPAGCVVVWSLGQAGFIVKGPGEAGFVAIDPYLSRAIEENNPGTEFVREFAPPLAPQDLKGATAVLVTHHHDDHMDPATLAPLATASPETRIVVPAPHTELLVTAGVPSNRTMSAVAGRAFEVGAFRVIPVAAAHSSYETDSNGQHLYLGYLIEVEGVRIYHSGDTLVTVDLVREVKAFRPHIVFLPINGGDFARTRRGIVGNMSFREAADFAVETGADILIPMHYDLFPNNRDNPAYLVDYLFMNWPAQKFHLMIAGERFVYMP